MKKVINQYGSLLQVIVLIVAMMLPKITDNTLMQWLSLCLLWMLALWKLRNPNYLYTIIKDKAFVAYLIFVIWAIFSSFFLSVAKSISIMTLITFLGGALSYFIAYTGNEKKELYFDRFILFLGVVLVFYTCYQKFALDMSRPVGLMRNWNTHAAFLAMIILPLLMRYALKSTISTWLLVFISLLGALFAFAMGLTLSRGALLILVVGIVCCLLFAWRQQLFFKHSLLLFGSLIVGYLLNGFIVTQNIVLRLGTISDTDSLTALGSGRDVIWGAAWHMYQDSPLFGWGLGMFQFLYRQYKPPLSFELAFFAHNDYLQFLLELGPIGLLIFIAFICVLLKRLLILIINLDSTPVSHKIESFIYLTVCIGLLLHTFFTFHLYQLTMQIMFAYYLGRSTRHFYLAQSIAIYKKNLQQENKLYFSLYRGFVTILVLLMLCGGLSLYYLQQAEKSQNKRQQLNYYWLAGLFFPPLEHYDALSALVLSKKLLDMPIGSSQHEEMAGLALKKINAAIDKVPLNARNYATKAGILQTMRADSTSVVEEYEHALTNTPFDFGIRYDYAHFLVATQQTSKALTVLWGLGEE
ncbi:hypothetical protein BMR06_09225 [Methylococcaceae bacterium HT5]|nr:hypothetical protein BMR06_09225 [Methylococcaceae bacterium HT5]